MQFQVGPYFFRAVRTNRPVYDEEGAELEGRALERGRLLLISPAVEPARIEEVVRHEHYHAMRFYFPEPTTEEERAQFVAAIGLQFERDLEAGGGRDALLELPLVRLPRLDTPTPAKPTASDVFGRFDRVTCSQCDTETACGSVVNDEPEPHPTSGRLKVQRHFRCEACGTVTVWYEWCDDAGLPTGEYVPIPAPRRITGAEASRWLAMQAATVGA